MKNKHLIKLSIWVSLSLITPILVWATPMQDKDRLKNEEIYQTATASNSIPEQTEELDILDHLLENPIESTSSIEQVSLGQNIFSDYFPDPNFAQVIAKQLKKNVTDYTNEDELKTIKQISSSSQNNTDKIESITGIRYLTNLEYLSLYGHRLTEISTEISELSQLSNLSLKANQIVTIPIEIGYLINLKSIDLMTNQITKIPAEIGELTNLQNLLLGYNQITSIPEEISQLNSLTTLNLSNNRIQNLPSGLGELNNLTGLVLSNNMLNTISPEILNLTELKALYLDNNNIQQIPAEIDCLNKLTDFYVANNKIKEIPTSIANLPNLEHFDVQRNQISEVPDSLLNLLFTKLYSHNMVYSNHIYSQSPLFSQNQNSVNKTFNNVNEITIETLLPKLLLQSITYHNISGERLEKSTFRVTDSNRTSMQYNFAQILEKDFDFSTIFVENGVYDISISTISPNSVAFIPGVEMANYGYKGYAFDGQYISFKITIDKIQEIKTHNITVVTRYLDDALPEHTVTYQREHGFAFLESFNILDGYQLRNQPVFNVDIEAKQISHNTVDQDYTVILEFDKAEYNIRLNTTYLDAFYPETSQSAWIRYQENYTQTYEINDGYRLANLNQLPAGIIVNESNKTISISNVTQDYEINLAFEKNQYDVIITIVYEDKSRADHLSTYTVPYGERFETGLIIEQGYGIKKVQIGTPGVSVNRSQQVISISQVTDPVSITITVR